MRTQTAVGRNSILGSYVKAVGRALDAAGRRPAPPVRDPLQRVRAARKGPDPA